MNADPEAFTEPVADFFAAVTGFSVDRHGSLVLTLRVPATQKYVALAASDRPGLMLRVQMACIPREDL